MISNAHPFQKTIKCLDQLIHQLELNTGRQHTPFTLPIEHEITNVKTENLEIKPIVEEVKVQENVKPEAKKEKNQQQKSEKNQKSEKIEKEPSTPLNKAELLQLFPLFDIRVGKIIECWKHPNSEKLYCEKIDLGDEVREIASGVQKEISIENMSGLVLVASNLKPRKLGGFQSNGMVLMASNSDHTIIELLRPDPNTAIGERVFLEGLEHITKEKAKELNPKQNIMEKCLEVMKTNEEGYASFGGMVLRTSKGLIKSQSLQNSKIS